MKKHSEFIEFLKETFEEFGMIDARRMFGGYGIYHEGIMFGLVANNTLYLKGDETTEKFFKSMGLSRFKYDRVGKKVEMSYYQAPEEVYDDREKAALWAGRAYEVALKQGKKKVKPYKKR